MRVWGKAIFILFLACVLFTSLQLSSALEIQYSANATNVTVGDNVSFFINVTNNDTSINYSTLNITNFWNNTQLNYTDFSIVPNATIEVGSESELVWALSNFTYNESFIVLLNFTTLSAVIDSVLVVEAINDSNVPVANATLNVTINVTPDTRAPAITAVKNGTTDTTAQVNWTTDEAANSTVEYGATTNLGTPIYANGLVTSHVMNLTGLSASTQYFYNVTSCDSSDNCNTTGPYNFTTQATPDTRAPAITAVKNATTDTTAQVNWTTDEAANSTVDYGPTTALGTPIVADGLVGAHVINVTGLSASTQYFYNLTSCDAANNCNTTGPYNFTTQATPDTRAPAITTVKNATTDTTAQVNWTTDEAANSTVEYGTTTTLGTPIYASGLVTSHIMNLTGLTESTLYYYNLTSCDSSDNCNTTGPYNFTTEETPVINFSITKSAVASTVNVSSVASFIINVTNFGTSVTGYYVTDSFNNSQFKFNGTNDSVRFSFNSSGTAEWNLNISTNETVLIEANFSVEVNGSLDNTVVVKNESFSILDTAVESITAVSPDTRAPAISAVNNATTQTTAQVNWTTDEAANSTVEYGTTTTLGTPVYASGLVTSHVMNLTGLSATTQYFYNVTSCDALANCNTTGPYNFTTDAPGDSVPTVTVNSPVNDSNTTDSTPAVSVYLSDDFAASISYITYVDGSAVGPNGSVSNNTNASFSLAVLADGSHTFTIQATDNNSNSANSSTFTINVDTTAPTVSNRSTGSLTNSSIQINWTTDEPANSSVEYGVSLALGSSTGSSLLVQNRAVSLSGLTDNTTYYYNLTSCDALGNCASAGPYNFTTNATDTGDPSVTVNSPSDGSTLTTNWMLLNFTATDTGSAALPYVVYVDNVSNATGTATNASAQVVNITGFDEGTFSLVVQVTDAVSNAVNSSALSVSIDTSAPSVSFSAPANNSWSTSTSVTLTATASDNTDTSLSYTLFVDGSSSASGSLTNGTATNLSVSGLNQSNHSFLLRVTDDASRTANTSNLYVAVDSVAPTVTVQTPSNGTVSTTGNVTVNWSVSELNLVTTRLRVDNVVNRSSSDNTVSHNVTGMDAGAHRFKVSATDAAGQSVLERFSVIVDLPLNLTAFVSDLDSEPGISNISIVDAANSSINYTGNGSVTNITQRRLTINLTAPDAANGSSRPTLSFSNFTASEASYGRLFTIETNGSSTNDSVRSLGSSPVSMLIVRNASDFLPTGSYVASVKFNITGLNYDYVYYCGDDDDCSLVSQCSGNSRSGYDGSSACFVNGSASITIFAPSFSSFVLSLDNIVGSLNVTAPINGSTLSDGSDVYLNFTASESVEANLTLWLSGSALMNNTGLGTGTSFSDQLLGSLSQNVLADGTYTVALWLEDSFDNVDYVNYSFTVSDGGAPSINRSTGSIDEDSAVVSVDVSEYANITVEYGTSTALGTLTAASGFVTSDTFTLSSLSDGTTYYYNVTAVDVLGNSRTVGPFSFATDSSSSSSSGSSGGSSGGGAGGYAPSSTSTTADSITRRFNEITPDAPRDFVVISSQIAVKNVLIAVLEYVDDPELTIRSFTGAPSDAPAFPATAYQYLELSSNQLTEEILDSVDISFSVPRDWVDDLSVGPDEVALYRLVDDSWVELRTSYEGLSGSDYTFVAESPGFSYFVVGAVVPESVVADDVQQSDEVVGESDEPEESEEDADVEPEPVLEDESSLFRVMLIVFVLAIAVVLLAFWFHRKDTESQYPPPRY